MDICRLLNALSPSPGRTTTGTATAAAAANDPTDDDYTGATIPQLPPSPLFDTYDGLFAFLRNFHLSNGSAIVKASSSSRRDIGGIIQPSYIVFKCDRGPRRTSQSSGLRKPSSQKLDCPVKVTAKATNSSNKKWTYTVVHGQHNHGQSLDPSAHIVYRRRTVAQRQKERELANENGIRAREMLPKPSSRSLRAGVLVRTLRDEDDRVCAVFWTYDWCRTMWKKFPEVLGLDNTYKTNRFGLHLFQATGVTDQKSLANFAFGLINGEKEHHFQWLCDRLDELRIDIGADTPEVIITDKEQALRTALSNTFPGAQQQLCVYHILANVRAKINARWKDTEGDNDGDASVESDNDVNALSAHPSDKPAKQLQPVLDLDVTARGRVQDEAEDGLANPSDDYSREGMFKAFQTVVYAVDHDTFKDSWKSFVETFGRQQRHILRYIQKEYMPWRKQWVKCYIDRYRNFGQRVNSPTETAHADVKSHLVTGTGDLLYLHQALVTMIDKKSRSYRQEAARQIQRQRDQYLKQAWLGKLNLQITYQAIDLIAKQYRFALAALPDQRKPKPLRACTGNFEHQYGLPCSHRILDCLMSGTPLRRSQIAMRWWLEKPLNAEDKLLEIRDPAIVRSARGRPRLNADNKKLKVPRYLKIADYTSKPGSDADDTDDDDAETEPAQRSQGRHSARGRGLSRQPSQTAGRGTRRLNASLRRDRSQFELDELQSHASQSSRGNKRRRVRGGAAGRSHAEASQAERSPANQVQTSRESSAESCIIIPGMQWTVIP
ncbi:transposase [Pochonia chlamydosporia 170]|uniref:Transposase n=1 Tax=Pochonia chlamydosporia 170 TaxID=1380566 RepID=A0A179EYB5_METCM|nr:transposase [Pochonia chlamydosporia 170]OAQ58186.2 transposase [Pochonia chlamydosporia 170]